MRGRCYNERGSGPEGTNDLCMAESVLCSVWMPNKANVGNFYRETAEFLQASRHVQIENSNKIDFAHCWFRSIPWKLQWDLGLRDN